MGVHAIHGRRNHSSHFNNLSDDGKLDFVDDYLRTDGVLIFKMIRLNMGVQVSRELVIALLPLFIASSKRVREMEDAESGIPIRVDSPPTTATTTTSPSPTKFRPLLTADFDDGDRISLHSRTSPV